MTTLDTDLGTRTEHHEPESAAPAPSVSDPTPVDQAQDAAPPEGWELLWVDPRTLIVGANTRTDAALDKQFVGSVKDRGIREPIIVHRDEDGALVVRKGQRRTLAAVQVGLDLVPVVVEPERLPDENARLIDRIIDQLGENQHRTGLPEADQVAAHQQLLQLGLSAGQIARRTRTGPARVRATLAVGGSEMAARAMGRYHLSLDQAAVIAEFDDVPDAVTALVAAAKASPGQFEHVAQRARDARAETRLRADLTARLEETGIRMIDRPDPYRRGTVRGLDQLRPAPDSESSTALSEAEHTSCPGHVAWLDHSWRGDEPLVIAYGCDGWVEHGHAERYAAPGRATSASPSGAAGGPLTDEQKAERRQIIANNKAWASATTVRLAWLRQFLARRTPPKDAAHWIVAVLADGNHDIRRAMEDQHSLARDLLGLADTEGEHRWYRGCGRPHPISAAAQTATPARASMLTLALLLAAFEDGATKNTWRDPSPESAGYLSALATWGYELAEVEQLALTNANPTSRQATDRAIDTDQADGRRADGDRIDGEEVAGDREPVAEPDVDGLAETATTEATDGDTAD